MCFENSRRHGLSDVKESENPWTVYSYLSKGCPHVIGNQDKMIRLNFDYNVTEAFVINQVGQGIHVVIHFKVL